MDYRKRRADHAPIHIDGAVVEQVKTFKDLYTRQWRKVLKVVKDPSRHWDTCWTIEPKFIQSVGLGSVVILETVTVLETTFLVSRSCPVRDICTQSAETSE